MALRTTIGMLVEDVSHPFSSALHRAVVEQAGARGVQVLAGAPDVLVELDGLIVAPLTTNRLYSAPTVFVDRFPAGAEADTVVSTNVAGAAGAVRHLISHGHRRIAYLGDRRTLTTARDRHRGYLRALGGRAGPQVHDLRDAAAAERATIALLRRPGPPTAIFAGRSQITIGVVRALRRLGRQHTVALVGFDDFPLADLLDPAITVVAQDPERMGRTAALALFERIDGDKSAPREIRIPTTLIPRGSGELAI
jgi:LacI family transcriptional regulator